MKIKVIIEIENTYLEIFGTHRLEWLRQCIEVVDRFAWENKILGSKYTLAGISLECIVFPCDLLRKNDDLFLGMNQNHYQRISKNRLVFSFSTISYRRLPI